jgi:hypothetical protein
MRSQSMLSRLVAEFTSDMCNSYPRSKTSGRYLDRERKRAHRGGIAVYHSSGSLLNLLPRHGPLGHLCRVAFMIDVAGFSEA